MVVTTETPVEKLMEETPECIAYFIENRVSPFSCAGAYPATLGEMLSAQKVEDIDGFVAGLNDFFERKKS